MPPKGNWSCSYTVLYQKRNTYREMSMKTQEWNETKEK